MKKKTSFVEIEKGTDMRLVVFFWFLSVLIYPALSSLFPDVFSSVFLEELSLNENSNLFWSLLETLFFLPLLVFGMIFFLIFKLNGELVIKNKSWSWIFRISVIVAIAFNALPVFSDLIDFYSNFSL